MMIYPKKESDYNIYEDYSGRQTYLLKRMISQLIKSKEFKSMASFVIGSLDPERPNKLDRRYFLFSHTGAFGKESIIIDCSAISRLPISLWPRNQYTLVHPEKSAHYNEIDEDLGIANSCFHSQTVWSKRFIPKLGICWSPLLKFYNDMID